MARDLRPAVDLVEVSHSATVFSLDCVRSLVDDVGAFDAREELIPEHIKEACPSDEWGIASLAFSLNSAAHEYALGRRASTRASRRQLSSQAERVSKACDDLLCELGLSAFDAVGDIYDALGPGALYAFAAAEEPEASGKQRVEAAITSVKDLRRWALAVARRHAGAGVVPRSDRRVRDKVKDRLFARLESAYFQHWLKEPGVSRAFDTNAVSGPFVRFLIATVPAITGSTALEGSIVRDYQRSKARRTD